MRAHHLHLPKLDDAGVLAYDPDEQLVRRGSQFESAISLLSAITDHRLGGQSGRE